MSSEPRRLSLLWVEGTNTSGENEVHQATATGTLQDFLSRFLEFLLTALYSRASHRLPVIFATTETRGKSFMWYPMSSRGIKIKTSRSKSPLFQHSCSPS